MVTRLVFTTVSNPAGSTLALEKIGAGWVTKVTLRFESQHVETKSLGQGSKVCNNYIVQLIVVV